MDVVGLLVRFSVGFLGPNADSSELTVILCDGVCYDRRAHFFSR